MCEGVVRWRRLPALAQKVLTDHEHTFRNDNIAGGNKLFPV